jgi:hypothetical protein
MDVDVVTHVLRDHAVKLEAEFVGTTLAGHHDLNRMYVAELRKPRIEVTARVGIIGYPRGRNDWRWLSEPLE